MKSFPDNMPARQQKALRAEMERQQKLSNGWHACFDFTWTGSNYRKQWYVVWRWGKKTRDTSRRNYSSRAIAIKQAEESQKLCMPHLQNR